MKMPESLGPSENAADGVRDSLDEGRSWFRKLARVN